MPDIGYFNVPLLDSFRFSVTDGHQLYVEICGNPSGIPVVFFHGGPGAKIDQKARGFFNPDKYKIVLFDQRGTGNSIPFLSLENNTPFATLADTEALRKHLEIEKWIVFGGSYGTTLGLLYALTHPERVMHLVLRGIFLGRDEDIQWLFQGGAGNFYPEEYEKFRSFIEPENRDNLVQAYYGKMTENPDLVSADACKRWADWENGILRIVNDPLHEKVSADDLSAGLLEAHYFAHQMFWKEDNYILNRKDRLQDIPMDVFHGRFDVDCRVKGAWDLKKACPHIHLHIIQEGSHYPYDFPLFEALVQKMDELAAQYS